MTDTLQTAELDKILEQAFTDGASDTMWQNDRHIEIYATAKARLEALINSEVTKKLEAVLAVLPEKMTNEGAGVRYDIESGIVTGYNAAIDQATAAITNLVEGSRGETACRCLCHTRGVRQWGNKDCDTCVKAKCGSVVSDE